MQAFNFIDAGQKDPQRVRSQNHQGQNPPRQHSGDLPEAEARGGAAREGVRHHTQSAGGSREHGEEPQAPARHDPEGLERGQRQVQEGGEPARGTAREQEEAQEGEGDRAAHPHEEQTRTRGTGHQEGAARGHRQGPLREAGRSHFREVGLAGVAGQNGGRHRPLQPQHRQSRTVNLANAQRDHQEHSARAQHVRNFAARAVQMISSSFITHLSHHYALQITHTTPDKYLILSLINGFEALMHPWGSAAKKQIYNSQMLQQQLIYQMTFQKWFLLVVIVATVRSYTEKRHVLLLTPDDFPDILTEFPQIIIQFYASECEHSKKLAPIFNEIAKQFNQSASPIRFGSINAKEYATVRGVYQVKIYPTLIYFNQKQRIKYFGEKSKEAIVSWLNNKLKPPVASIDVSSLKQLGQNGQVNILFHGSIQTHEHGSLFQKLALGDEYNKYYSVQGTELPPGTIQMFRPFDQPVSTIIDIHLDKWIVDHQRPFVVDFDARTINKLFGDRNVTMILFQSAESTETLNEAFREAAQKVRGDWKRPLICTSIKLQSPYHKSLSGHLKIAPNKSPIVILDGNTGSKFVLINAPSEITSDKITQFIARFQSGTLKSYKVDEEVAYGKKAKGDEQL